MPILPLKDAFTARAIGVAWDNYQQTLGLPPYLGRSFFGTDKRIGLELSWIKGSKGLPVALKASNFDALAPLRDPIGFGEISNTMPFFRESYMVSEKDEQDYDNFLQANNLSYVQQILRQIFVRPLDLIQGADVVPERMIWQLLAPVDGVPKIDIKVEGDKHYSIEYTTDGGTAYKATNYIQLTEGVWSDPTKATPILDLVKAQEQYTENTGDMLTTFIMNQKTWKQFVNANDTRLQVQGKLVYEAGVYLRETDVKSYLLDNYGITVLVYNKLYVDETGATKTFIPDGVVTAIGGAARQLGTVWYGTTPEERSGDQSIGNLSIVNTGVAVYTYTTPHPINTHCVVSEIVLPSYENMDSVVVMKVA